MGTISLLGGQSAFSPQPAVKPAAGFENTGGFVVSESARSTEVHLSDAGRALSVSPKQTKKSSGKHDDIDSSSLPDEVKRVLKMIREIKEQLQAQQQELAKVMADRSLGDEAKKVKLAQIQSMISSLSGTLVVASSTLNKLMQNKLLTPEQKIETVVLLGA